MIFSKFKSLLSDIRFWIGFLFSIRLVGITNAPLESGHNWRQAFTNTVTRNYVKHGFDFLHPQINMAGEKSGIVGAEFPIFNFFSYLLSSITQYQHWHGRLINLLVTSIGLYFFYKLVKVFFKEKIAFSACLFLGVSIWFGYGRKIMPDSFSVSLVITGLWFGYNYLMKGKWYQMLLFSSFISLGMLSKIPSLFLIGLLVIVPFEKSIPIKRKIILILGSTLSVALVYLWYFYWIPELLAEHKFKLFFEKSFMKGIQEIIPLIPEALKRFYYYAFYGFGIFIFSLVGIYFFIKEYNRSYKISIAVAVLLFFLFILKTGAVFPLHNYYIIPFVPVMAIFAGIAVAKIPKKLFPFLLLILSVESIANQQHGFFIAEKKLYKLELEAICDEHIQENELIIINGGASHQPIYFANRKGWTIHNHQLLDQPRMDSLIQLGAQKLIIDKHLIENYQSHYPILLENDDFIILDLKN